MHDLKNNIDLVNSITPAARTSAVNGAGVDLANRDQAVVSFVPGTVTDGTHTPKVQESDDNSNWSDVAASDLEGTLAVLATDVIQRVGYKGTKQFIRPVVTSSGATGAVYGAAVIRGKPRKAPVS